MFKFVINKSVSNAPRAFWKCILGKYWGSKYLVKRRKSEVLFLNQCDSLGPTQKVFLQIFWAEYWTLIMVCEIIPTKQGYPHTLNDQFFSIAQIPLFVLPFRNTGSNLLQTTKPLGGLEVLLLWPVPFIKFTSNWRCCQMGSLEIRNLWYLDSRQEVRKKLGSVGYNPKE